MTVMYMDEGLDTGAILLIHRLPIRDDDTGGTLHDRIAEITPGALAEALLACRGTALVVGEETGWGIVPDYPAGRVFRDVLGRVQQRLATHAERAYLVVSGFALDLGANAQRIESHRPPPSQTE